MATKPERLYNLISEVRTLNDEERSPETAIENLGLDSLDLVEIVMQIEEEFDVDISDDSEKFKTIGDFIKFVEENGT